MAFGTSSRSLPTASAREVRRNIIIPVALPPTRELAARPSATGRPNDEGDGNVDIGFATAETPPAVTNAKAGTRSAAISGN